MAWSMWPREAFNDASLRSGLMSTPLASTPLGFTIGTKLLSTRVTCARTSRLALNWYLSALHAPPRLTAYGPDFLFLRNPPASGNRGQPTLNCHQGRPITYI